MSSTTLSCTESEEETEADSATQIDDQFQEQTTSRQNGASLSVSTEVVFFYFLLVCALFANCAWYALFQ